VSENVEAVREKISPLYTKQNFSNYAGLLSVLIYVKSFFFFFSRTVSTYYPTAGKIEAKNHNWFIINIGIFLFLQNKTKNVCKLVL